MSNNNNFIMSCVRVPCYTPKCNASMRCWYTSNNNKKMPVQNNPLLLPKERNIFPAQQVHPLPLCGVSSECTLVNCRLPCIKASLASSISSLCSTNFLDIARNTSSTPTHVIYCVREMVPVSSFALTS